MGEKSPAESGFRIISAHSDSPCFKIKPNAEIYGDGGVVSLNVEKYGGGIMYTWFDRPLSISGRVMTAGEDALHPVCHLVDLKVPVAFIPHLAIHFNRGVNEGNPLSVQKDMKPVVGFYSKEDYEAIKNRGGVVKSLVADHLGISPAEILEYELCLYPLEPAATAGASNEYFQSARIDDLSMAYAGLEAMLATADLRTDSTRILAVFDNEETGSMTRQGAGSTMLTDVIDRICRWAGKDGEQRSLAIQKGMLLSADNAHAVHPNYPDKADPTSKCHMNGGIVVKHSTRYATDAATAALFKRICERANVPTQDHYNNSSTPGGGTLGLISGSQVPIPTVDIGLAQLAMHSPYETAGREDLRHMVDGMTAFYNSVFSWDGNSCTLR